SPRGATTFVLWEPPLTDLRGEGGAPVRRTANAETADLLADLVANSVRTLAFVRSRRGAETVALAARARLEELTASPFPSEADAPCSSGPDGPPYGTDLAGLPAKVAAYRAGYLADDRRALERALR